MDASGKGLGIVMRPDCLAFSHRKDISDDSIDRELQVLVLATSLLNSEQDLPTTFYTDCKSILAGVKQGASLKASAGSYRYQMLITLRKSFPKNGQWKLEWVKRRRNRVADQLSRRDDLHYLMSLGNDESLRVYSLRLSEQEFCQENGHRIREKAREAEENLKVAPKHEHMSASEYLRSCLWPPREHVFACT